MPYLVGLLGHADPHTFLLALGACVNTQVNGLGVLGEQGEIHTGAVPSGPQWIWSSCPYFHGKDRSKVWASPKGGNLMKIE